MERTETCSCFRAFPFNVALQGQMPTHLMQQDGQRLKPWSIFDCTRDDPGDWFVVYSPALYMVKKPDMQVQRESTLCRGRGPRKGQMQTDGHLRKAGFLGLIVIRCKARNRVILEVCLEYQRKQPRGYCLGIWTPQTVNNMTSA